MASESVSVSGPVAIESSTREAVALELMRIIMAREKINDATRESRAHWLTLYRQCYKATNGDLLVSILKEE